MPRHRLAPLLSLLLLAACSSPRSEPTPPAPAAGAVPDPLAGRTIEADTARPPSSTADSGTWEDRTLDRLSLRERAAQLMMPFVLGDFAPVGSSSHSRITSYVSDLKVGGVIMSVGMPTEVAAKLNALQELADVPLLVAADLETGAGFRLRGAVQMPGTIELGGATDFPTLMALGAANDEGLAYEMGRITAVEARAVGIHVAFAPVLDVNNNPDNPIINVRSFGEDPALVSELGVAFVRGVQEHGAVATGKHFPGHGDTDTDSHLALPIINHDRARMDRVELMPFRAVVDAGMGAVMTAHIAVPHLSGGVAAPVTLAPEALNGILRDEMGFDGLVFTDAMDMRAITRLHGRHEATVRAIEAGADIILMPPSPADAIEAIVDAVQGGRISEARLDASVRRILRLKQRLGLQDRAQVEIAGIPARVGIPGHAAVAREIAERSITVLKNVEGGSSLLPLRGTRSARVLSVTYRRTSDVLAGRHFNRRLRDTYPRLQTATLDRDASAADYQVLRRIAREQDLVIVSAYVTAVSYAGSVALPEETIEFVRFLREAGRPHIVISFGNPYLVSEFPDVRAYMLAWSGSRASQFAAARALLGEFEVSGRTPTRIPPSYEIGDGVTIRKRGTTP